MGRIWWFCGDQTPAAQLPGSPQDWTHHWLVLWNPLLVSSLNLNLVFMNDSSRLTPIFQLLEVFNFSWFKQAKHGIFMIEPPFFIKHIWLPECLNHHVNYFHQLFFLTTSCRIRIASNKTQVELQLKLDIWVPFCAREMGARPWQFLIYVAGEWTNLCNGFIEIYWNMKFVKIRYPKNW